MYIPVKFSDIQIYASLGQVRIEKRLFIQTDNQLCEHDLKGFDEDWLWLRSYVNEHGQISYSLEASIYNGDNYRTIEVVPNILHSCNEALEKVQRAVRRKIARVQLKKTVAVIRALSNHLPLDLIVMCLPWYRLT